MNKRAMQWILAAAVLLMAVPAFAQTWVPVGTAEGGVAVYYNDTTNEDPSNVWYVRLQFANSTADVNGAHISMFEPFKNVDFFGDQGQYGFDGIAIAPTADPNLNPPVLYAYDWNGTVPEQGDPVLWAMNVYSDWYNGPTNPSAYVLNSTLRGTSGSLVSYTLTDLGDSNYKAEIAVTLDSDGLIHWYTPGYADTPFPYPFTGKFLVTATLYYYKDQDATPGMDFYQGTANLYAQAIPDASTVTLFTVGLLPLGAWLRSRKA